MMARIIVVFHAYIGCRSINKNGSIKLFFPGSKSVVGTIIDSFKKARIRQIIVVTGGYRDEVEAEVAKFNAEIVFNPDFKNGEMIRSFQVGMSILNPECSGVL